MGLKEKVAIVTGASRGIGHAIAERLAEHGAHVVCVSTRKEKSEEVAKQLEGDYSTACMGLQADVANADDVQKMVKETIDKFGQVDILVNNAGITRDNLLLRMTEEEWDQVLDTNLSSVFNTTKAVLRPMLKKRTGSIINVTSVVGEMGNPGQANYAASKAGMIGFTKSIAREIGTKGIRCNCVSPGFIQTDMIEALPKEYLDNIMEQIPLKRLGTPQDIANVVLFLASDAAAYVTGQVYTVDGGIRM